MDTAKQIKIAIESRSGIQGVRVMLRHTPFSAYIRAIKMGRCKFFNNISYCENGMKVRREYNIGQRKFLEWSEFNPPETISIPHININKGPSSPKSYVHGCESKKGIRSEIRNQKLYLSKLFHVGEQTGHKPDANNASKSMREARNIDGSFLFDAREYLTAKQIASFFSRLARKRRAAQVSESKEEELEAQVEEDGIENLARNIINEIGLIHPIMLDTYNLCDLATGSKLSKFSISMLQEICTFYDLDTSFIKAKRKKPYIEIITNFIGNCTCQE